MGEGDFRLLFFFDLRMGTSLRLRLSLFFNICKVVVGKFISFLIIVGGRDGFFFLVLYEYSLLVRFFI